MALWRNGLARWTSDPEVPGSSPAGMFVCILVCFQKRSIFAVSGNQYVSSTFPLYAFWNTIGQSSCEQENVLNNNLQAHTVSALCVR